MTKNTNDVIEKNLLLVLENMVIKVLLWNIRRLAFVWLKVWTLQLLHCLSYFLWRWSNNIKPLSDIVCSCWTIVNIVVSIIWLWREPEWNNPKRIWSFRPFVLNWPIRYDIAKNGHSFWMYEKDVVWKSFFCVWFYPRLMDGTRNGWRNKFSHTYTLFLAWNSLAMDGYKPWSLWKLNFPNKSALKYMRVLEHDYSLQKTWK